MRPVSRILFALVLAGGCTVQPVKSPVTALNGKYHFISTGKHDDVSEPYRAATALLSVKANPADFFNGEKRADAKTSVAEGNVEPQSSIASLRASLKSDNQMRALGITEDSERFPQEARNVAVRGVIYAISKESDNDFHLIVGDKNCRAPRCIMNVEVSGLPATKASLDFATLSTVRKKFLANFSDGEPGSSGYDIPDEPIPVSLTGSLFFDVDHGKGTIGPGRLKPSSVWEIHPVTDITFEQ